MISGNERMREAPLSISRSLSLYWSSRRAVEKFKTIKSCPFYAYQFVNAEFSKGSVHQKRKIHSNLLKFPTKKRHLSTLNGATVIAKGHTSFTMLPRIDIARQYILNQSAND